MTVLFVLTTGLGAAWLISDPEPYWRLALPGFLWQLAAVLDRCDGEIARVKLCESRFGTWFDTVIDNLAYVAAYARPPTGCTLGTPSTSTPTCRRWPPCSSASGSCATTPCAPGRGSIGRIRHISVLCRSLRTCARAIRVPSESLRGGGVKCLQ